MELMEIKRLVLSKGTEGIVDVPWPEIEPLLEDNIDYSDKKKRFKMKLKSPLAVMGFDFMMIGNSVRFTVRSEETSTQKPKGLVSTSNGSKKALHTPSSLEGKINAFNYIDFAENDPTDGIDFGHDYIFPAEFEYIKFTVEDELCFPMLVGDASAGKSRMGQEVGKRVDRHDWDGNVIGTGRPVIRINLEEITEEEDLVGCPQLITNPETGNSETIFMPGILLEAWLNGWILIFDELDRSTKAARKQLNMITEIGGQLMVKTHQGFKFFKKHPDATFIFTANTWGHGDFTGMYDGAEPLNTAWLSRIGPKFEVKTDWAVFEEVLKEYNLPERVLYLLFEYDGGAVPAMYDSIKNSNLQESITLRSFIRFARCYKKFGWHYGLETCVINEFKEFNREKMRLAISGKINADFKPRANFETVKDGILTVPGINSEQVQTALREMGL